MTIKESPDDRDGIDGDDPMAEVGPDQCEPGADDCDVGPDERSAAVQESEFKATDEVDEAFTLESLATPLAKDNLPDHSADAVGGASEAHPFTIETVCCIEDKRQYVELFEEELLARGWKKGWFRWQTPEGKRLGVTARSRYTSRGKPRTERHLFRPDDVYLLWDATAATLNDGRAVAVRPIRERCVHYRRQHFANDHHPDPHEAGHNIIFRNCNHPARRSIGGASMSLRDDAIYGCDYREPFDDECVKWLDRHDDGKIETRPDLVRLPMLGMAGDEVRLKETPTP